MANPSRTNQWQIAALTALVCLTLSVPTRAQDAGPNHHKLDSVVADAVREGKSVRAIVRFHDEGARSRGARTIAGRGGSIRRSLNDIGALNTVVDAATAQALADDDGVAAVSVDAEVRASGGPAPRGNANAKAVHNARREQRLLQTGNGIAVAVIDSGVAPHADLPASRIRAFVDFVNGRTEPYDDFGHGTHVAGIVAGSGAASAQSDDPYVGMAPEVDLVVLKVLDGTGAGRTSDVIAALEWVAANHAAYNIRVVNMSLGHPVYEPASSDPLVQAADALVRRGIVVVASAGNQGTDPQNHEIAYGGVTSPANGPSVIAVGAVDSMATDARGDDRVTDYSSRGPTRFDLLVKPDLVASGHRIVSLAAPGSYLFANYPALHVSVGGESNASYMTLSGTSMAAPAVSGVAALMVQANPGLSAGAVRAVLAFTAQHVPDANLLTQGAGSMNAPGAIRLADTLKPQVEVGSVWLKSRNLPEESDEIAGEFATWGKHVIWGDRVLLGDSAYLHLKAWDDNIVWGQDDNIVWGQDNIVWGQDNIVWGQDTLDNIVWGQCDTVRCENAIRGQDDNIVWGQDDNIVWGQDDNIVWGQDDNIVWGQDNIVWGQNGMLLGYWADNTLQGFWADTVDWTRVDRQTADNIVWGQDDNIVWGQDNIVWGQDDNIVWGQGLAVLTKGAQ